MKRIRKLFAICVIFVVLLSSVIIPAKAEIVFNYPDSLEEYDRAVKYYREKKDDFFEDFVDYREKLRVFGEFDYWRPVFAYPPHYVGSENHDYAYGFKDENVPEASNAICVYHTFADSVRKLIKNDPLGQTMLYQRTQVTGIVAREQLNYYYEDGYLLWITFRIKGAELRVNLWNQSMNGTPLPGNSVVKQLLSVDEEEFQEGYAILWDAMGGLVEYPSNFSLYLRMAWTITLKIFLPVLAIAAACFGLYKLIATYKRYRWKKTFGS